MSYFVQPNNFKLIPSDLVKESIVFAFSSNRLLDSEFAENDIIKARRASDDTFSGFQAKNYGTVYNSDIEAFIGASIGYGDTLYDQSGNGLDFDQPLFANQPKYQKNTAARFGLYWDNAGEYYLRMAEDSRIDFNKFFTFWTVSKTQLPVVNSTLYAKEGSPEQSNPSYSMSMLNTARPSISINTSSANVTTTWGSGGLTDYTLIRAKYNSETQRLKLKVNNEDEIETDSSGITQIPTTSGELRLGTQKLGLNRYHHGYIFALIGCNEDVEEGKSRAIERLLNKYYKIW